MPTRKSKPISAPRGKIQFESPHYRVYEKQPHLLYVAKGADVPSILVRDTHVDAKYIPYKYRHRFTAEDNDCLQFAEGLVLGVVQYRDTACAYRVDGSHRKFGVADKGNVELARKYRKDASANPRVSQAYAIVRTNLRKALQEEEEVPPYHIAHVILEDGDWRVTLEADAGTDLKKPIFGIYSVSETAKSFHEVYKNGFGEEAAATIVLEKAPEKTDDREN